MDCPSLPNRIAHRRLTECRIWSLARFDWAEDMQGSPNADAIECSFPTLRWNARLRKSAHFPRH